MHIWTLVIERFDGNPTIIRAFTTRGQATAALRAYVAKEWRKHLDPDYDPMPADPDDAVAEFFTHAVFHHHTIKRITVEPEED